MSYGCPLSIGQNRYLNRLDTVAMESSDTQPLTQSSPLSRTESRTKSKTEHSEPSRVWLWTLLTLFALGGGLAWWFFSRTRSPQPRRSDRPALVKLVTIELDVLQDQSSFIGVLDAQEGVHLKPEMDGRVVQLFVNAGDQVSLGDPMLKLSPDRNQAEVNTAIANTNVSRASLTNAQAQVRAAEAEHLRAEADVALQEGEIERMQYLVGQGAASQQQLDVVIRNRDGAIASRTAAAEQIQVAQAAVQEAEAALNQARSQVSVVEADLADTLIAAPINGIVGETLVKVGDYVESGDDLTTIVQNQTLDLALSVPIHYREQLRLGLPVQIHSQPNPSGTTGPQQEGESMNSAPALKGRISFISPQVDVTTQTVTVEAAFDNTLGYLSDDQRVEASILWRERSGILVPATAISRLAGQSFIFVVVPSTHEETGEPQLIVEQRSVTLGAIQGNEYQVLDGLEPGDTIVISGILGLSNGQAIQDAGAAKATEDAGDVEEIE